MNFTRPLGSRLVPFDALERVRWQFARVDQANRLFSSKGLHTNNATGGATDEKFNVTFLVKIFRGYIIAIQRNKNWHKRLGLEYLARVITTTIWLIVILFVRDQLECHIALGDINIAPLLKGRPVPAVRLLWVISYKFSIELKLGADLAKDNWNDGADDFFHGQILKIMDAVWTVQLHYIVTWSRGDSVQPSFILITGPETLLAQSSDQHLKRFNQLSQVHQISMIHARHQPITTPAVWYPPLTFHPARIAPRVQPQYDIACSFSRVIYIIP